MDYLRIYNNLINNRKENPVLIGYTERHHIIPRSLGGSDDPLNLVRLTAREHFIAHILLHKIHKIDKTAYALFMMQMKCSDSRAFVKTSRMYEWARKEFSKFISKSSTITSKGERNSQFGSKWICNLELQINKKIKNWEVVPESWIIGRNKWKVKVKNKSNRTKFKNQESVRKKQAEILWNEFKASEHSSIKAFAQTKFFCVRKMTRWFKKYIDECPKYEKGIIPGTSTKQALSSAA